MRLMLLVSLLVAGCAAQPEQGPMPPLAGVRCPPAGTLVTYGNGRTGRYDGEDPNDTGVCLYTTPNGERRRYLGVMFQLPRIAERQTRLGLASLFPLAVGKEASWRGGLRPTTPGSFSTEMGIPADYRARVIGMRDANVGGETHRAYAIEITTRNLVGNDRQSWTILIDERTGVDLGTEGAEASGSITRVAPYRVVGMERR